MKIRLLHFLIIASISTGCAQVGSLDPTFGGTGIVIADMGGSDVQSRKMLLQPDGKIIAFASKMVNTHYLNTYGQFAVGTEIYTVVRYNANGTPDASFGTNGKIQFIADTSAGPGRYSTAALQTDGKILLSGNALNTDSTFGYFACRLNTDGSIDASFGIDGKMKIGSPAYNNFAIAIAQQTDGKIIQGGFETSLNSGVGQNLTLVRFLSNGIIDSTFGVNGISKQNIHYAYGMTILPSGKFLILSYFPPYTCRLNADGSKDTSGTFSSSSQQSYGGAVVSKMDVANDGSIFLASDAGSSSPFGRLGIIKETADQSLDSTFNEFGYNSLAVLKEDHVKGVAAQADNKVIALADAYYYDTTVMITNYANSSVTLVRFAADGSVDPSFGNNGIFILDTTIVTGQVSADMTLQPDGKILVLGQGRTLGHQGLLLMRLQNDVELGIIDFSDKENILHVYPNPIHRAATITYDLPHDECISIDISDMEGRCVQRISSDEHKTKGHYSQAIQLKDNITTGSYVLRITNGQSSNNAKISVR